MSADEERKKIIQFIKNYYGEFGKTPSMKEIQLKCKVNPRVFYELFGSQKEAFNLAGVPYNDEARSKVEKANVARKFGNNRIIRLGPSSFINSALRRNLIINKYEEEYVDKYNLKSERMMEKLGNIYSKYRQINPNDYDYIKSAYDQMIPFIMDLYPVLQFREQQYESIKAIRYSTSRDKYLIHYLGYDFNDIEGSHKKICEKEFTDKAYSKKLFLLDIKSKAYFKMMLDEVFGVPPDLTIDI
ncbi:MAG: hypothetical protein ABSA11_00780 [Candidatus Bathyarchaeia archaeon]|jgi:hypothetical protein